MNRLMIRHTMDKPLPYDAEVEYIENDGHCILNTGIIPNQNTSIVAEFYMPKVTGTIYGIWLFGGRDTDNTKQMPSLLIQPFDAASTSKDQWRFGPSATANAYLTYRNYGNVILSSDKRTLTITSDAGSETVASGSTGTFIFAYPLLIMGYQLSRDTTDYTDPANYANTHAGIRLVRWQMYDGDTLVQDVIPVRKGNVGYAYDKITRRFLDMYRETSDNNFSAGPDYNPFAYQYLTFVPLEDSTFSFAKRGTGNDIEYSIDGGTWTSLASEANTPTVGAGHNIRWRAELTPSTTSDNQGIGTFSATGLYDAMGNTMSLLYGDNFVGQTTLVGTYTFRQLWFNDTHIYRADRMALPATTLANYCYYVMFQKCTSLTTAPELPATTLASYCYYGMFNNCTSLVSAPELPATILAQRCYQNMFYGCTSLTTAPELPATTLAQYCYNGMFNGCHKINYIKCLATNISASLCTDSWVDGVASTGTFVKAAGMENWSTGANGIPSGWTVVDDPSTINS